MRGQHTEQPIAADRPANLWQPVPGPHAAHGPFDHRGWLFAAGIAALGLWLGLRRWR